ncbi:hypothetical protein SUNI508_11088 [Seiridium unicorne]|uniref:HIT-type domain-containing protein n=1 Tax=Seiridium unicorne TaxID=138068 RepID=A0ABR2UJ37_9PEZI
MAPRLAIDRTCVGCEAEDGKYKCPRCMKYTCSLACSKKHREEHPAEEEKATASQPSEKPADGTGSTEQPDEFNKIFAKHPNLVSYLHQIADETDPPSTPAPGLDNGDKAGYQRKQSNKPWTREIGLQNALHKLRKLRDQDNTGALQEFCDLVRVLNAEKAQEEARRLEAKRDAEVIGRLIREERE